MENLLFLIKLTRQKRKCCQRSVSIKVVLFYHKLLQCMQLILPIYMAPLSHVSLAEPFISIQTLQAMWSNFCNWYLHSVWCSWAIEACTTLTASNQNKFAELADKVPPLENCNLKSTCHIDTGPLKKVNFLKQNLDEQPFTKRKGMVQWEIILPQGHESQKHCKRYMHANKQQHISYLLLLFHCMHNDNYNLIAQDQIKGFCRCSQNSFTCCHFWCISK